MLITFKTSFRLVPAIGMSLLLSACSSSNNNSNKNTDDETPAPPETVTATLEGTAAIGQAIENATVTATCQDGSGFTTSPVTTDANGKWSAEVDSEQLPCLLELKNGTPDIELNSMAFASGTVNITPLTHLALAIASTDAQFSWKQDRSSWPSQTLTEAAINSLVQSLKEKGYAEASLNGNPFIAAFDADGTGWDEVLDKLRQIVEDPAGTIGSLDNLTQLLADGNLAALPEFGNVEPEEPVDPEPQEPEEPTEPTDPEPEQPEEPSEATVQTPVGSADFGADSDLSQDAFISLLSRAWPVAIYEVPETNPEWYGEGSISFSGNSSEWVMELKGADGSVISSLNSAGAFTSALTSFSTQNYGFGPVYFPGQVFINKGVAITEFMNVFVEWDSGLLEGNAGGNGEVKFRNSLNAYGEGLPATIAELVGTWTASASVYCNGPYGTPTTVTNQITITATGQFTLEGQSQLCGTSFPQVLQWGGLDDFLIPDPEEDDGAYIMHIDSQDLVNVSAGTLQVRFDADMNVTKMSGFFPEVFELKNPVKQ